MFSTDMNCLFNSNMANLKFTFVSLVSLTTQVDITSSKLYWKFYHIKKFFLLTLFVHSLLESLRITVQLLSD